jgi:hypothetical protein
MGRDLRLRTAATNGSIVRIARPAGDGWAWRSIVVVMAAREKLLTRPPELSGSPASRDIWERVGGMDGVRILRISI